MAPAASASWPAAPSGGTHGRQRLDGTAKANPAIISGNRISNTAMAQSFNSEPRTKRVLERSKRPDVTPLTPLRCVRGSAQSFSSVRCSVLIEANSRLMW